MQQCGQHAAPAGSGHPGGAAGRRGGRGGLRGGLRTPAHLRALPSPPSTSWTACLRKRAANPALALPPPLARSASPCTAVPPFTAAPLLHCPTVPLPAAPQINLVQSTSSTLPFENGKQIRTLAVSPDGRLLLSVDAEGRALVVNRRRRALLHHFSFKGPVRAARFSPDGQYVAAAVGRLLQVRGGAGAGRGSAAVLLASWLSEAGGKAGCGSGGTAACGGLGPKAGTQQPSVAAARGGGCEGVGQRGHAWRHREVVCIT